MLRAPNNDSLLLPFAKQCSDCSKVDQDFDLSDKLLQCVLRQLIDWILFVTLIDTIGALKSNWVFNY